MRIHRQVIRSIKHNAAPIVAAAVLLLSGATAITPVASAAANMVTPPVRYVGTETPTTNSARLTAAKLRVCKNRQAVIQGIMRRIGDRGQRRLNLFTTIAGRAEAFYTDKGKTLATYEALLADVHTKEATAQAAVDALQGAGAAFSCDSSDPQGAVTTFRNDLRTEVKSLQAYRSSIRALIVGIKSVTGTTNGAGAN